MELIGRSKRKRSSLLIKRKIFSIKFRILPSNALAFFNNSLYYKPWQRICMWRVILIYKKHYKNDYIKKEMLAMLSLKSEWTKLQEHSMTEF